jgi:ribosome maturation factor RimP
MKQKKAKTSGNAGTSDAGTGGAAKTPRQTKPGNGGKARAYAEAVEKILAPIAESSGVRVYDVEYVKEGGEFFLRAYIDRDGGVTIGDCENVSRALSDALDTADPIPDAYTLEVSSPGLGRTLTKDRHLANSIGQKVEVKLYRPPEGSKVKEYEGTLTAFDKDTVTIDGGHGGKTT